VEFELAGGFVEGTNVLEFVVNNAGDGFNPTGFRAELTGSAQQLPPAGVAPTITRQPEDLTVAPKEPASFSVNASGSRPVCYQWRLDHTPVAEANGPVFSIASVYGAWVGGYDVVVWNDWGTATSRVDSLALRADNPSVRTYEPPGPSSRRSGVAITEMMYLRRSAATGATSSHRALQLEPVLRGPQRLALSAREFTFRTRLFWPATPGWSGAPPLRTCGRCTGSRM
jgi:hypothetical protein